MGFWMKLLDLLERSVLVQAALPLLFGGACVVMALRGQEVPDWLLNMALMTLTFWMGAKGQHAVDTRRQGR